MLAEQRYAHILDKLSRVGGVRTADLGRELSASAETIRKDLEYLDQSGQLTRVHGGAVARGAPSAPFKGYISFETRQEQNRGSKHAIALKAAELVEEGQSVALDSGTSSYELAKVLGERFRRLTIVTNSLKNAMELVDKPGFTVIATGGVLTADEHSFVSDFATLILDRINIDIMFLTTCGVSLATGITDQRIDEVRIHNRMRAVSRRVIVLADSTKFGATSLIRVCRLDEVDAIVTDGGIDQRLEAEFVNAGHRILVADSSRPTPPAV